MPDHQISKQEFIARATEMFGAARVKRQEHTITPCPCGSEHCAGWRFDPGVEDDPLFVFNPPVMEV